MLWLVRKKLNQNTNKTLKYHKRKKLIAVIFPQILVDGGSLVCLCSCVPSFLKYTCAQGYIWTLCAWWGLGGHLQEAWSQRASDHCGTACGESRPLSHFVASWAVVQASNCRQKTRRLTLVIRQFNTLLPQSVCFSCWDWDGWPGYRNCPSVCKPLIQLKCQQAKHWNLTGSRKAAVQQICPPCGYEQAKKEFPYGINKAPHYCSAYSFICLLIKCVCSPPTLSILSSFGHSFSFSRHVTNFINKGCDYKQIHMLWLSWACSINPGGSMWKTVRHHFGSD